MPDHSNIPDIGRSISHPKNDPRLLQRKGIGKDATVQAENTEPPSRWERLETKIKNWLKIGE
jgi:hypothetical protein